MYLKIKNKKIEIRELTTFWDRFKGLKFVLEPIEYGVYFPHKRFSTTNFLCQKIDVVLTDKENVILYVFEKFNSEKYIIPKKNVYNTYFLPLNTVKFLEVGKRLEIVEENDDASCTNDKIITTCKNMSEEKSKGKKKNRKRKKS